jgi:hypothetical protein
MPFLAFLPGASLAMRAIGIRVSGRREASRTGLDGERLDALVGGDSAGVNQTRLDVFSLQPWVDLENVVGWADGIPRSNHSGRNR